MQCLGCELQKVSLSLYKMLEAKNKFLLGLCPGVPLFLYGFSAVTYCVRSFVSVFRYTKTEKLIINQPLLASMRVIQGIKLMVKFRVTMVPFRPHVHVSF